MMRWLLLCVRACVREKIGGLLTLPPPTHAHTRTHTHAHAHLAVVGCIVRILHMRCVRSSHKCG